MRMITIGLIGLAAAVAMAVWLCGCAQLQRIQELDPALIDPVETEEPGDDVWETGTITTGAEGSRWWPVVDTLQVSLDGKYLTYELGDRAKWGDVNGCCADLFVWMKRDEKWIGGPCDSLKQWKGRKEKSCVCVPDGEKRMHEPIVGETIKVTAVGRCRYGKPMKPAQRSETKDLVWK